MKDPKHALLMLNMAATDMQAVTNMMEAEKFSDSVFGFHAQQAIEKLCKAWLSMEGIQYPRTHDLRMLMRLMKVSTRESDGVDCWPSPSWFLT